MTIAENFFLTRIHQRSLYVWK